MTPLRHSPMAAAALAFSLAPGICSAASSVLGAEGLQAQQIESAWWLFFAVCGARLPDRARVARLRTAASPASRYARAGAADRAGSRERTDLALAAWVGGTVVLLAVLTAASYATDARLVHLDGLDGGRGKTVDIEVTAHQWWWQVRYLDPDPSRTFVTANEIHVPVGVPVTLTLRSPDVIHSFWVPDLHGKQDLIPGRENMLTIQVDEPGVYRGQCAEFCGMQHAHMAFLVVAEEPEAFEAWRAAQLSSAAEPATDEERQRSGRLPRAPPAPCVTASAARQPPDGWRPTSRTSPAAGRSPPASLPMTAAAISPPGSPTRRRIKPGNHMPNVTLLARRPADRCWPIWRA